MPTVSYTAGLAYYDGSWHPGETAQGCYSSYRRTGVLCFAGMNLSGKVINSVSLTVTSKPSGYNASKSAFFYRSAYQRINTSANGTSHRTGTSLGSVTGTFYNNTLTIPANFLKARIAAGENTFCIYATDTLTSGWSANYLRWTNAVLTVSYSEPDTAPPVPTAPVSITPSYGTTSYYHTVKPTISWSGATGGQKYLIERAVSGDYHLDTWNVIAETALTSFTDSALEQSLGDYVRYRVKTVADELSSGYIYTGNIRRMLPDTAPTELTVSAEQNLVDINWIGQTESFVTFRVEYSANGGDFTLLRTTSATGTVHDISDLPLGSSVIYRVRSEQASVDSQAVIASAYTVSTAVTKKGGIFIKKTGWTRGVVWHRHSSAARPAGRIFIKINGHWRESN